MRGDIEGEKEIKRRRRSLLKMAFVCLVLLVLVCYPAGGAALAPPLPARRDRRPDFNVAKCSDVCHVINDLNGISWRAPGPA